MVMSDPRIVKLWKKVCRFVQGQNKKRDSVHPNRFPDLKMYTTTRRYDQGMKESFYAKINNIYHPSKYHTITKNDLFIAIQSEINTSSKHKKERARYVELIPSSELNK